MDTPSSDELRTLNEKIAATAIVNNAVIRCQLAGLPVSVDNVILCVADFFDPTDPKFSGLIRQIERMLETTLGIIPRSPQLN